MGVTISGSSVDDLSPGSVTIGTSLSCGLSSSLVLVTVKECFVFMTLCLKTARGTTSNSNSDSWSHQRASSTSAIVMIEIH